MTFNPDADVSDNKVQRRGGGRTAAIAGGGVVGLGAVVVLLISAFTGVDLSGLLGGGTGTQAQPQATTSSEGYVKNCKTGADANKDVDCRVASTKLALNQYWTKHVKGYVEPGQVSVDVATATPCGTASNDVGPFYCPSDQTVYIDPTFFQVLKQQFGAEAGDLAQVYVVAHEYGHHIQNITGTMSKYPNNGTGPTSNGVRTELQADCYAGAFIADLTDQKDKNGVAYFKKPTEAQITDALNAAAAVGDDHIQQQSAGYTNPESWTHGSSAQREKWFASGYKYGLGKCDTFAVATP
ncbi:neutral zinc metallopeptidase [Microbacterium sp. NPDC089698]|jgi:predicted metalloprotease|uniref:KPN_02809 family neutral zinc metallopeptidase n=1 Tax=unclassified Microbacterium TaxID=2609290 RepID=UPI0028392DD9|nr:neutral zinc metallopeptidase [Microbacterium sp.]MDR2320768.1 neutral zinc metallopeptidase [Microbacterium sp.]